MLNDHSDVAVHNQAYVDPAFLHSVTQKNDILKFGTPKWNSLHPNKRMFSCMTIYKHTMWQNRDDNESWFVVQFLSFQTSDYRLDCTYVCLQYVACEQNLHAATIHLDH